MRASRRAVALALLAACSPGLAPSPTAPGPSTTAGPPGTTIPAAVVVDRFESCLSESGMGVEPIPLDAAGRPRLDLVMPEVDFSDPGQVEAFSECALHLSSGALDLGSEPVLADLVMSNLNGFSECVRDHGVPGFPDPVAGFRGLGPPYALDEIPLDDPDLGSAASICSERLVGSPS